MLSPPTVATAERGRRFEELYAAHHIPLLGYALRRTDNTDDAADVLAETFMVAWRRIDEIPPDPKARLWLYGTARRVLANQRRGERRRLALADRLKADLAVSYRPQEQTGELADIAATLRQMPESDRELLALSAWEGLDPGQIATVLGCSPNAARIRLHRARRRFAVELRQYGAAPERPRTVTNGDRT
ncbi:MAG TPA: sigma-70 family RNA polymerase sigma factor [Streptosporangiaceae bacterium]